MRGANLVLLSFLLLSIFHYSRWALPEREELPAVLHLHPQLKTIALTDDRGSYHLYQFSDGSKMADVTKLTPEILDKNILLKSESSQPIISGELVKVTKSEENYLRIEHSWLSARYRVLLQIPLHPDRMTTSDWEVLPGVGPKLAKVIENDRQKNGDFIEFSALKRVKGIGPKKLEAWEEFFKEKNDN